MMIQIKSWLNSTDVLYVLQGRLYDEDPLPIDLCVVYIINLVHKTGSRAVNTNIPQSELKGIMFP